MPASGGVDRALGRYPRNERRAIAVLLSQWELAAIAISFVRQDVEDAAIKSIPQARSPNW